MKPFYLGVLLAFVSAAGFGMMPIFALFAYEWGVNVFTLLIIRFTFASFVLFTVVYVRTRKMSVGKNYLLNLFLLGGILYTLMSFCYFSSVQYIPASMAVLLFCIYPVIVAILSFFVEKEVLSKSTLLAIVLSLIGLTLVLGTSFETIHYLGVMMAFSAAIIYSCYIVIGNRQVKQLPSLITSAYVTLFAALSLFMVGSYKGAIDFHFQARAWLPILGITVFSTVIAIFALFKGLELIGSTKTSILSMIEPLVTIVFSAILLHERLTMIQICGGLCVIAGAVLVILDREQRKEIFDDRVFKPKREVLH